MQDGAGSVSLWGRLSLVIGYLLFVRWFAFLTLADGHVRHKSVLHGKKDGVPLTHMTHQKWKDAMLQSSFDKMTCVIQHLGRGGSKTRDLMSWVGAMLIKALCVCIEFISYWRYFENTFMCLVMIGFLCCSLWLGTGLTSHLMFSEPFLYTYSIG